MSHGLQMYACVERNATVRSYNLLRPVVLAIPACLLISTLIDWYCNLGRKAKKHIHLWTFVTCILQLRYRGTCKHMPRVLNIVSIQRMLFRLDFRDALL